MDLYVRVKELADKRGISLRALEISCGFGNGTIKKWETQSPSFEKVVAVAYRLNTSIQFLATGTNDEAKPANLTPAEEAIYELVHPMSEADKYKIAGAIPILREMQNHPFESPQQERVHKNTNVFVGSSSRD